MGEFWSLTKEERKRIADIENVCGLKIPRCLEHYAKVQKLCGDKRESTGLLGRVPAAKAA